MGGETARRLKQADRGYMAPYLCCRHSQGSFVIRRLPLASVNPGMSLRQRMLPPRGRSGTGRPAQRHQHYSAKNEGSFSRRRKTNLSRLKLCGACPRRSANLADETERHLGQGVGLAQHGYGGLRQNLIAHEIGHFRGDVNVGNLGFRGLQIFRLHFQVGDGVSRRF